MNAFFASTSRDVISFLVFTIVLSIPAAASPSFVSLKISSERTVYKLGEIVSIESQIKNNTAKTIAFGGDEKSGTVLKIAFENSEYKTYVPASLKFTVDGINFGIAVDPGKSLIKIQEILWNYKPQVFHLNAEASRSSTEGRILTDLAFPIPGKYLIQLHAHVVVGDVSKDYKSKPVEIVIIEPEGKDAGVWSALKQNGDISYFMQYSELPRGGYYEDEERDRFQMLIQNLIAANPRGLYAARLQRSLHLFRLSEIKRIDFRKSLLKN